MKNVSACADASIMCTVRGHQAVKYIIIDGNVVDCLTEPICVCVENINMQAHWMNLCVYCFFFDVVGC